MQHGTTRPADDLSNQNQHVPDSEYSLEEISQKHVKALHKAAWVSTHSLIAILVASAVFIPLHYFQETRPQSMWVIDSHGPISDFHAEYDPSGYDILPNQTWENKTTGNWSDCFRASPPADKLGFFDFWWHDVKGKPLQYLLVL